MALTNSPPIDLLAIQNEFSAYGLLAAASAAGVSANMLAFLGKSSYTPQLRVDTSTAFTDTTFTVPANTPMGTSYMYIVVGGGGAGGYVSTGKQLQSRGGGGGGQVLSGYITANPGDIITYRIGAGGASGAFAPNGDSSVLSSSLVPFSFITAAGGVGNQTSPNGAASGNGNAGGTGGGAYGGGGGGAGGVGSSQSGAGTGIGGLGQSATIGGVTAVYGGGGGGGSFFAQSAGGAGGGGGGALIEDSDGLGSSAAGYPGTNGQGGGGGGAARDYAVSINTAGAGGGAGGAGRIIIYG